MAKTIKTRIQQKHDIEANWLNATNFVPLRGELIIYDSEYDENGNELSITGTGRTWRYDYARHKIGDGKTNVNELPFLISFGAADPDAQTTAQFYFKYNA